MRYSLNNTVLHYNTPQASKIQLIPHIDEHLTVVHQSSIKSRTRNERVYSRPIFN